MHEVVINVVRPQTAQLLPENLFRALHGLDEVVGQLGGQTDLVPAAVPAEDLPHRRLAAGVDIGSVQVVHAAVDGRRYLPLRLVQVDAAPLAGEAHTAVAQEGDVPVFLVLPVLHCFVLLSMN